MRKGTFIIALSLLLSLVCANSQGQNNISYSNTAIIPVLKLEEDSYDWWQRHADVMHTKDSLNPQIVLIGNSITHFWGGLPLLKNRNGSPRKPNGPESWQALFGNHRVLNLGFGWDRTQNVLWRIDSGELDNLHPKLVIIEIGTNNTSNTEHARINTAAEIAAGVAAICERVHAKVSKAKIVLMAIFPREQSATHPRRVLINETNVLLQAYAKKSKLIFIDTSKEWLTPDGEMLPGLTSDLTHPTEKGYTIWANAVRKYVNEVGDK
ncbi:MAG: GDSL-type esterase/lipase family protein [Chitinophagaceae bacterium]